MERSRQIHNAVPMLAAWLLLFGSIPLLAQQSGQSPAPDAPSANTQKQSETSNSSGESGQAKTAKPQTSTKSGSKTTPQDDSAASNPFPTAQSEAAAKADAQQDASKSSQPIHNGSSPNPSTPSPATDNPDRKSGQTSPAKDNPFPEEQSKAAAKPNDSQGGAGPAGKSQGSGIPQPGSSSSSKGGYSSSDAHLPDPDVGEGNLGTHPRLDSYTRDQNPDGRVDDDLNSADLYMKNGNYRGGFIRYQDALQYDPENDTALYGIADALCKQNQTSEAMAHFKSYVTNNPQGKYARKAENMLAHPDKCAHNR
jgi:Tetratricopeptide repeat